MSLLHMAKQAELSSQNKHSGDLTKVHSSAKRCVFVSQISWKTPHDEPAACVKVPELFVRKKRKKKNRKRRRKSLLSVRSSVSAIKTTVRLRPHYTPGSARETGPRAQLTRAHTHTHTESVQSARAPFSTSNTHTHTHTNQHACVYECRSVPRHEHSSSACL